MAAAVNLSQINSSLLPRTIAEPIFNRTVESSAVMALARRVPLSLTGNTTIPVSMDVPVADWVAEGARKPVSTGSVGIRQMAGKKIAVLVPVSMEVVQTNAAGLYAQLRQDLPTALARGFDYAAVHGKRITNGAAGPFSNHLTETTKAVALGTATQANGGMWDDLVAGEELVVNDGWDFDGFVADPRLRPILKRETDNTGRPLFVDNLATAGVAGGGSLAGYPASFNRGVSGLLNRQSNLVDQGVRAVGGDFSQAAYGIGMDITIRVSTEASYVDADNVTHSAFQENLVLLLAEAYFGFVLGDPEAFVKYTVTPLPSS